MGNKTAYKTRHARTEDENAFYSELSEAMINARIEENVTQQVMGKICGYSEQQIRKYEQIGAHPYSTDKVYPIPAYIMMQYARRLHKSAEELCSNWFDNNEKTASPMYRKNLDKMRSRLKKITDTERDLIMNLRKIKRVGVTRITKFLTYCDMGDVIPISSLQEQQLNAVWCSAYFYGPWYKTLLALCDYLKIDVPAFYIAAEMPLFAVNLSGAVFPGGDIPYSTDIFVRDQDQPFFLLKTLIHELRHVWQHTYHNEMFIGYSSYNRISDQDAYWKQPSEIDADAFAYWVLEKNGVSFILEDLGQERCRELRTQMQEYEGMEAPELDILHIEEQLA